MRSQNYIIVASKSPLLGASVDLNPAVFIPLPEIMSKLQ